MCGGIAIGELFIDDTIVWGKGLIKAYEIENSLAVFPRVIISKEVIKKYDREKKESSLNLNAMIVKDKDGLDYINFLLAHPNIKAIPQISKILKNIVDEMKKKKSV